MSGRIAGNGSATSLVEANQEPARPGTYREIAPPAQLREYVECFWHKSAGAEGSTSRILPDGCIDVIWAGDRAPVIAGPQTLPFVAEISAQTEVVGVRFRPGVAPHLLGVSARDLLDQHVSLRAIWSYDRAAEWLDVMMLPELDEKLDWVSELIAARLAAGSECDRLVQRVVLWTAGDVASSVDELTQGLGISQRQLRRRFLRSVGYGPKTLQRVLRLQRLLWLARAADDAGPGLARLAVAAGYTDQPHMTRETTALTGATPRQLLLDSSPMSAVSDLFKTTAGHDAKLVLSS